METTVEELETGADMAKRTSSKKSTTPRRKASPGKPLTTRTRRPSPPKRRK